MRVDLGGVGPTVSLHKNSTENFESFFRGPESCSARAMAARSSAGCPDPPAAVPPSSASPNPLAPVPPVFPLPSHFSPQSILGRPPNPSSGPAQGILYTVGAAGRGYPPRPAAAGRGHSAPPHVVTVANPAGYIRNNSPTAVVTFSAPAVQTRPLGFPSDHGVQMYHHLQRQQFQQHGLVHQGRPPFQPPQGQQQSGSQVAPSRTTGRGAVGAPPMPDFAPTTAPAPSSKVIAAIHSMVLCSNLSLRNSLSNCLGVHCSGVF